MEPLAELKREAEYALISALTMIGHSTSNLKDYAEYMSFSNICLPMRGGSRGKSVWEQSMQEPVARHATCMDVLRQTVKSAPKYRKKGHDYCEDMLEMCVRSIMRPGVVRFTRTLEATLGWPMVEQSGVLSHIPVKPKTQ